MRPCSPSPSRTRRHRSLSLPRNPRRSPTGEGAGQEPGLSGAPFFAGTIEGVRAWSLSDDLELRGRGLGSSEAWAADGSTTEAACLDHDHPAPESELRVRPVRLAPSGSELRVGRLIPVEPPAWWQAWSRLGDESSCTRSVSEPSSLVRSSSSSRRRI